MLHLLSTVVLFLLIAGIYYRRNRVRHLIFMVLAFLTDLGLVLYIEITRHAVEKVAGGIPPILIVHVSASVIVMILYLVQIGLGISLFKGATFTKSLHARVGITFCCFRATNYITSFMIQPS